MISLEIFTEQAEYIPDDSFKRWTITHHEESTVIKKLSHGGAKLITGPRGCGKTTLMLKAYNRMIKNQALSTFPVYVNFKSSLKLEPLYRNNANAAYWFNQWLLFKVLQGIYKSLSDLSNTGSIAEFSSDQTNNIVNMLELGRIDNVTELGGKLNVLVLEQVISRVIAATNKNRCVLLLDDAGHAFSSEQQHDFFEFFREIKTKEISPKAAIYPGVTTYSSSFHVGHDAEEIDVWLKPSASGYLDFMHAILQSRLSDSVYQHICRDKYLLDLMCYAAYGIPRALLNMISKFVKDDVNSDEQDAANIRLEHQSVLRAIKDNFNTTYQIYDSLKVKLPMYSLFVDVGASFYEKCLTLNKTFNKGGSVDKQSSVIAIKRPLSSELSKVIGFFQYAGLIAPQGISSRGGKGVYELYELHYSAIIDRNVFFSSRGISAENYCLAFVSRPSHHYPRHTEQGILGRNDVSSLFSLALPPCEVCNAPRVSEEAKFCAKCGAKLKDASIFESIVSQSVSSLPITAARARSITEHSRIRTIKDVLMDYENRELRSVHMIGPVWAQRIRSYAEEFIA